MMICNPRLRAWHPVVNATITARAAAARTSCAVLRAASAMTALARAARTVTVLFVATATALVLCATTASAQLPDSAWDSPRVTELMDRARARRLLPAQDTSLHNYTAKAEGFVYFYLDRRDTNEQTLIKTDQIALELFWAQPDFTKQRIVGMRDESRLPNRMHYHLDHLTVVQNGFGNLIRIGDGDEVRDVPHPAAPASDRTYSFRLADSLTITLHGSSTPIRVYEIEVKPHSIDLPALVGSIFVDRANADVVRATFTFTPVSYVDPRLDYISVSLDNSLWEGRYWLPHEQTLQIRRQVEFFDFAASAIIHGRMRVRDYSFNDSLPASTFQGYPVTTVPEAERERYAFERGLYDDINELGLAPPPDLAQVRARAARLLGTAALSGLPPLRLGLSSASNALRYNRAEGVAVGLGLSYTPGTTWRADVAGGYAFGAEQPWGSLTVRRRLSSGTITARAAYADVRDIGVRPALPGAINTISAAVLGKDYLDPYYVDGAQLTLRRPLSGAWSWEVAAGGERHRTATLTQRHALFDDSAAFRPVRHVSAGDMGYFRLAIQRPIIDARADAWGMHADVTLGTYDSAELVRSTLDASLRRSSSDHARELLLTASTGLHLFDEPRHLRFYIGGINTLPGYGYRAFSGMSYVLLNAQLRQAIWDPWIGVRGIGAFGAAGGQVYVKTGFGPPAPRIGGSGFSAGAGLSLFWDLLHIDAVRGVNGGDWQVLLSFHRDFWDIS